jgi:hypothetical protein
MTMKIKQFLVTMAKIKNKYRKSKKKENENIGFNRTMFDNKQYKTACIPISLYMK